MEEEQTSTAEGGSAWHPGLFARGPQDRPFEVTVCLAAPDWHRALSAGSLEIFPAACARTRPWKPAHRRALARASAVQLREVRDGGPQIEARYIPPPCPTAPAIRFNLDRKARDTLRRHLGALHAAANTSTAEAPDEALRSPPPPEPSRGVTAQVLAPPLLAPPAPLKKVKARLTPPPPSVVVATATRTTSPPHGRCAELPSLTRALYTEARPETRVLTRALCNEEAADLAVRLRETVRLVRHGPYSTWVEYAGITFRSVLEAQHAMFFDLLGVRWAFEPERFVFRHPHLVYIPDFFLPELRVAVEVKGRRPSANEVYKASRLSAELGPTWTVVMFVGSLGLGTSTLEDYTYNHARKMVGYVWHNGAMCPGFYYWAMHARGILLRSRLPDGDGGRAPAPLSMTAPPPEGKAPALRLQGILGASVPRAATHGTCHPLLMKAYNAVSTATTFLRRTSSQANGGSVSFPGVEGAAAEKRSEARSGSTPTQRFEDMIPAETTTPSSPSRSRGNDLVSAALTMTQLRSPYHDAPTSAKTPVSPPAVAPRQTKRLRPCADTPVSDPASSTPLEVKRSRRRRRRPARLDGDTYVLG